MGETQRWKQFNETRDALLAEAGVTGPEAPTLDSLAAAFRAIDNTWSTAEDADLRKHAQKDLADQYPLMAAGLIQQRDLIREGAITAWGRLTILRRLDTDRVDGTNKTDPPAKVFQVVTPGGIGAAIKLSPAADSRSHEVTLARRLHEFKSANVAVNPRVVQVFDVAMYRFENDEVPHLAIIQEYIDGVTLDKLDRATMTPRRAVEIVGEAAETMDFLLNGLGETAQENNTWKKNELYHLDIKPTNIMIRAETHGRGDKGSVALIDFETAAMEGQPARGYTNGYVAPEALVPGAVPTPAWDVFGLGGVLYFLLTGDNPPEKGPLPDHEKLRAANAVLRQILQKSREEDPKKRYNNAGAMAKDLCDWYFDYPVEIDKRAGSQWQRLELLIRRCRGEGALEDVSQLWGLAYLAVAIINVLIGVASLVLTRVLGVPLRDAFIFSSVSTNGVALAAVLTMIGVLFVAKPRSSDRRRPMNSKAKELTLKLGFLLIPYVISFLLIRYVILSEDRMAAVTMQVLLTAVFVTLIGMIEKSWAYSVAAGLALLVVAGLLPSMVSVSEVEHYDALIQGATQALFFTAFAVNGWMMPRGAISFTSNAVS